MFGLISFFAASFALHAATFEPPYAALPLTYGSVDLDRAFTRELIPFAHGALDLVYAFPPDGDHIFHWRGKRDLVAAKHMRWVLRDSRRPFAGHPPALPDASHMYVVLEIPGGGSQLDIVFFVDRMVLGPLPNPRYQFAHFALALAESLYGPAHVYLESRDPRSSRITDANVGRLAALGFLMRVMRSDRYDRMDDGTHAGFAEAARALRTPGITCGRLFLQ